jgi:ABC-type phosphate transport system permease subunit
LVGGYRALFQSLLVYLLVKLLVGSVVLAIMALPIITISEDAMRNTPRAMKELV